MPEPKPESSEPAFQAQTRELLNRMAELRSRISQTAGPSVKRPSAAPPREAPAAYTSRQPQPNWESQSLARETKALAKKVAILTEQLQQARSHGDRFAEERDEIEEALNTACGVLDEVTIQLSILEKHQALDDEERNEG